MNQWITSLIKGIQHHIHPTEFWTMTPFELKIVGVDVIGVLYEKQQTNITMTVNELDDLCCKWPD